MRPAWLEAPTSLDATRERRKLFVNEEMKAGDMVVATCRATCIIAADDLDARATPTAAISGVGAYPCSPRWLESGNISMVALGEGRRPLALNCSRSWFSTSLGVDR
jgi:hypothetical protein